MDLHESPRVLSVFASSATSSCIFRHDHYPLFSLLPSFPVRPNRRSFAHTCNHWFRGFHKLQGWETFFFVVSLRARAGRKLMTFNGYAILHDFSSGGGKKGEKKFDFSKGVIERHAPQSKPHHRFDASRAKKRFQFEFFTQLFAEFSIISEFSPQYTILCRINI